MESHEVVAGYHDDVRRDIAPYVPAKDGSLLDIGGGTGATAAYMKSQGLASHVGVFDQVPSEMASDGIDFHRSGDLEDLTFLDEALSAEGPFDTILTLDILEHLVDPWAVVQRLHSALKPGGHIVASIPNVRHYRVAGGLLFKGSWELQDAGILDRTHLRFFVKKTAIELMTHTGLQLELVASPNRNARPGLAKAAKSIGLEALVAVDYVVRVRRIS